MNTAEIAELEKRSMSTWTPNELRQYSIATGQICPQCEVEINPGEAITKCPDHKCPMMLRASHAALLEALEAIYFVTTNHVTAMRMAKDAIKKARACEVIKPVDICYDPWHKETGPSAELLRCPTCGWSL